jgi:hypothetical protein
MRQLSLISLTRTEEELVPVEKTARAELIDLMARLLVIVLQNQVRRTDERTSLQSQDQAGTPGA